MAPWKSVRVTIAGNVLLDGLRRSIASIPPQQAVWRLFTSGHRRRMHMHDRDPEIVMPRASAFRHHAFDDLRAQLFHERSEPQQRGAGGRAVNLRRI